MRVEILIIGGGPAGLGAALEASKAGAQVLLVDDGLKLGGQLVKQTHKFFGSKLEYAGFRGFEIPDILISEITNSKNFRYFLQTTAIGYYEDKSVSLLKDGKVTIVYPQRIIVATGAQEKMLPFKNCDLPGVYGAGAVQTLMNVYGVLPGKSAVMIGAGNIGLIVSYQLIQAGVEVKAVVEATQSVGGYWVHSAKIRRLGVPILTSHTIVEAVGKDFVEAAVIAELDSFFNPIKGTEKRFDCDTICIAVGLSPLVDILFYAGCEMVYVSELGGDVPIRNDEMETSVNGIYVAGDVSGIEEASSALLEGRIAGLAAARSLGYHIPDYEEKKANLWNELKRLRESPVFARVRRGLEILREKVDAQARRRA